MPSARRVRVLTMVVLAAVITTLFFTSQMRSAIPHDNRTVQDFLGKTMNGLGHQQGQSQVVMSGKGTTVDSTVKDKDGDGSVDEDDEQLAREMADRLRAAEQKAKDLANAKAPLRPDSPSDVIGVGSSAGGQKKGSAKGNTKETDSEGEEESEEDREVETTLNNILKKSPGKIRVLTVLIVLLTPVQLSSSRRHSARIRNGRRASSSRNIPSTPHLTLSSSTSTP